jgi:phosphate transport system permease protein
MAETSFTTHSRGVWQRVQRRMRHGDLLFWLLTLFFGLVVVGMICIIGWVTYQGSAMARQEYGLGFLVNEDWQSIESETRTLSFGALPVIYGTLFSSAIALILAAPVGIGVGVFLAELCPRVLRVPLSFMVELLAGIPSVVYGLWGIMVFVPFFRDSIAQPISETIGTSVPWLSGPVTAGRGLLVAGIVIGLMVLPTIAAITRDVVAAVPNHQREALFSLGATRWEVIRQGVLPFAFAGIVGAMMLGLGRALGETMAATMLTGNRNIIPDSLFFPGNTAASLIASQLGDAGNPMHRSALIYVALVLFSITLVLNLAARLLVWNVARKQT